MKKKIALLVLLALAMTMILTACNNAEPTDVIPRWKDNVSETYEYTIELADFNLTNGNISSPHFNSYSDNSEQYYKDFDVRVGEAFEAWDEVRPELVTGKFTLTISHPEKNYDLLETKQELQVTYNNTDNKVISEQALAEMLKVEGLVVSNENGRVTLKSTTETSVEFFHDEDQAPRKSHTKVNGFYVGKEAQTVSNYEVSTTYAYESKNTVVTTTITQNGGEPNTIETTLKRQTEGSFIDSNQLFTYARSLDKSNVSFQDSPSVKVYNPLTQTTQTAFFYLTHSVNAVLTNLPENEQLYVKIPALSVVIDGMPFMLQECAPTLKEKLPDLFDSAGNGPDVAFYAGYAHAKHTPIRFRVGYFSYELSSYDNELEDLWSALKSLEQLQKQA